MTLEDFCDAICRGDFSATERINHSLSEDNKGSLGEVLALLANDTENIGKTDAERIDCAERIILKIINFSDDELDHYNVVSAIINCGVEGEKSVGVQILKIMVDSMKFDVGAVFVANEEEKKDALETAVQQSVPQSVRQKNEKRAFRELNEFFQDFGGQNKKYGANKAFATILLSSGLVAGFEGEKGVEMANKIQSGEVDFRALAGRTIPDRDQSKIEAWLKNQSEDSLNDEVEVKSSSLSILGAVVSAVCSCLSFSCLSPNSRYQNSSDRS